MAGEHFTGGVVRATLATWRHGEVACPGCGLPVDAQHDEVEELRTVTSTEPMGAIVTHRRCGERSPDRMDALVWAASALFYPTDEEQATLVYDSPVTISPY